MTDFFKTVANVIIHTPLWVWPLYALLLFVGFQRTRNSTLPLWRVMILPTVVAFLAILSVISAGLTAVPAAVAGLIAGSAAGWFLEGAGNTRRLPDGRLWLRGEWVTFGQIVLVLVFRYAVNVAPALNPALYSDLTWRLSTIFISTALSGLFLGRTAAKLRVYFAPPAKVA